MREHVKALVGMAWNRYGRSWKRRDMRHKWIRDALLLNPKIQRALVYLGNKHTLAGGSKDKWLPTKMEAR